MKINANGTEISVIGSIVDENAYISLTDIAKRKNPDEPMVFSKQEIIDKPVKIIGKVVELRGKF